SSYSLPTTSSNGITGSWSPVFSSSTVGTTTYTFAPDTGQCAESFTHSINITNQISPSFTSLENTLCKDSSYSLPTTSSNGITGSWSPVFSSSTVGTTTYTFAPDAKQCAIEIKHTITISEIETPVFTNLPSLIFKDENYVFPTISENGMLGNWTPKFDSSKLGKTLYTFTPIDFKCRNIITHEIIISDELIIPLYFTPNNDNINDFWKILGLENYTNVKLSIFNRYGKLLSTPNIKSGWDGIFEGKKMPPNDYWYSLFGINPLGEIIIRKGHFSLLR
uniref:T9SS type B sorting domain-containing protein n=1 Tax=uncultured Polaribacter sp. TaxID=174711 RepID=UPI00259AEEAA